MKNVRGTTVVGCARMYTLAVLPVILHVKNPLACNSLCNNKRKEQKVLRLWPTLFYYVIMHTEIFKMTLQNRECNVKAKNMEFTEQKKKIVCINKAMSFLLPELYLTRLLC
jgi:hypothetical protein